MPTAEEVTVVVRPAERRDVHDIRAIDAQVYPRPWSEKMTIEQVIGTGRVHLVIEENHRVIGHGGVIVLAGEAHISTIAIAPVHQRRGLGAVLLGHLFAAAEANGCDSITLEVRASNEAAIGLYERYGMVSSGLRPRYYADNDEDAIIMWGGVTRGDDHG